MDKHELDKLLDDFLPTGARIIFPAMPVFLKAGEKTELDHRADGWWVSLGLEEIGPFASPTDAREHLKNQAEQRMQSERTGAEPDRAEP
jgi:hypothetical protein